MLNVTNNTASGEIGNVPSLLLGCHRARYAELLSPTEVAEMAADAGLEAAPPGWVIHAELSNQDIEHLTQHPNPTVSVGGAGLRWRPARRHPHYSSRRSAIPVGCADVRKGRATVVARLG